MAGMDPQLMYGSGQPTLTAAPTSGSGAGVGLSANVAAPHVTVIGLVAVALAVLFLLDRAGFRFAVTVGKR